MWETNFDSKPSSECFVTVVDVVIQTTEARHNPSVATSCGQPVHLFIHYSSFLWIDLTSLNDLNQT